MLYEVITCMEKVGSSLAFTEYFLYIYKKIKKMITTTEEPAFLIRSYGKSYNFV